MDNGQVPARTTGPAGRSPGRLGRELQRISTERRSQSVPAPPCRFPTAYFPPSLPLEVVNFIIHETINLSTLTPAHSRLTLDRISAVAYTP